MVHITRDPSRTLYWADDTPCIATNALLNNYFDLSYDATRLQTQIACQEGTQLHADIETHLCGTRVRRHDTVWNQFRGFLRDHEGHRVYACELPVADTHYRVAGTIDAVFELPEGGVALCDWKRAQKLLMTSREFAPPPVQRFYKTNYWRYVFQLNLYAHMFEAMYRVPVKELWIVQFHPKQTHYQKHVVPRLSAATTAILQSAHHVDQT